MIAQKSSFDLFLFLNAVFQKLFFLSPFHHLQQQKYQMIEELDQTLEPEQGQMEAQF